MSRNRSNLEFFTKRNESDIFFVNDKINHYVQFSNPLTTVYKVNQSKRNNSNERQFSSDIFNIKQNKDMLKTFNLPKHHHLNKSEIFFQDYKGNEYKKKLNKSKSLPSNDNYISKEIKNTPFQCKMANLLESNTDKIQLIDCSKVSSRNQIINEIKMNNAPFHSDVNRSYFRSTSTFNEEPSFLPFDEYNALKNKISQLKSNIFHDPQKEKLNKISTPIVASKTLDTNQNPTPYVIKRGRQSHLSTSFDWKDSRNELWLNKYYKDNSTLTAKQRRIKEMTGSLSMTMPRNYGSNNIALYKHTETTYDKSKTIQKALKYYKGKLKSNSKIQRQLDNISALNQNEYNKNIKYNKITPDNIHKMQIENISMHDDGSLVKKVFAKNGIHIFETNENVAVNNPTKRKFMFKVRENVNDKEFITKLRKAKEELKKQTGYTVNKQEMKQRNLNELVPTDISWNKGHLMSRNKLNQLKKNSTAKENNKRTVPSNNNNKITNIGYNVKYKNNIFK